MTQLSTADIEDLFTKKQLQKCPIPDLDLIDWDNLDFLAWFDKHDQIAMLISEQAEELVGLVLQKSPPTTTRPIAYMCSWCATPHSRVGIATFCYQGKTKDRLICHMLCADLACSAYVRGLKKPSGVLYGDMAPVERKISRINDGLSRFVKQVEGL